MCQRQRFGMLAKKAEETWIQMRYFTVPHMRGSGGARRERAAKRRSLMDTYNKPAGLRFVFNLGSAGEDEAST